MTERATVTLDIQTKRDVQSAERLLDDMEKDLSNVFSSASDAGFRDVKNLVDGAELKVVDNTMDDVSDAKPEQESRGMRNIFREIRGIFRSLSGVSVLLFKIGAWVAAGLAIFSVLEQPLRMMHGLMKMVTALLRPITDAVIITMMPLFHMLRPVVQMANAMMLPFREAAMTGMAAANQLIAEGTQMSLTGDADVGGEMIAEGMKGAFHSASLMMSGFVGMVFQPLADAMGIGNLFNNAMLSWQDTALEGIFRVTILNDTFQGLKDSMDSVTAATEALGIIDEQMAMLRDTIGEFRIENFKDDLAAAKALAESAVAIVEGDLEKAEQAANAAGMQWDFLVGRLRGAAIAGGDVADALNAAVEAMTEKQRINAAEAAMESLNREIGQAPGLFQAFQDRFMDRSWGEKAFAALLPVAGVGMMGQDMFTAHRDLPDIQAEWAAGASEQIESVTADIEKWFGGDIPAHIKSGLDRMLEDAKEYMGNSVIPEAFEAGLIHMSKDTSTHMSDIQNSHNSSLNTMQSATQSFGNQTRQVAGIVEDAVRRMERYAQQYHSALRRIASLERSLRASRNDR